MGDLVASVEEILWLKFGWLIWSRTEIMDESMLEAIFVSLRRTDGSRTVRMLTADSLPWVQ